MGLDVLKLPEDLQASLERQGLTDLPKLKHAFHSRAEYMHDLCRKHGLRSVEVRRAVDQAESYIESTQLYGRGLKPFLPWTKRKATAKSVEIAQPSVDKSVEESVQPSVDKSVEESAQPSVDKSVEESVLDSFKLAGQEGPFIYGGFGDDGLPTVQPVDGKEAPETESSLADIESPDEDQAEPELHPESSPEMESAVVDLGTDLPASFSVVEKSGLIGEIISIPEEEVKKPGRKGKRKAAAEAQPSDSEDSSKGESD